MTARTGHAMRRKTAVPLSLMVVFTALCSWAGDSYRWPLDMPKKLTSSFAEYRPGRFHAGIDLRTGDIGKDVHAAEDGYISRVRCSPWGYGKAIYLKLDDGYTVVYGHLDEFAGPIAEYVRQIQHERQSYSVDLYPGPYVFRVERGDVVARSGQTGTGAPHLHYEIRDPQNRPVNPRLLGITWPDTTRPIIRKVLIAPAGAGSLVNGDLVPAVLNTKRIAPGEYTCNPISAYGTVGFGIDVLDPANNGANKLGVHTVRATAADRELFLIRNDFLSYETNDNGVVAYHPYLLDEGRFLLQWRWPGNRAEPYLQTPAQGWYVAGEEPGEVVIETTDFLGNQATLTIPVEPYVPLPDTSIESGPTENTGGVTLDCFGNDLIVTIRFTAPEPVHPEIVVECGRPVETGAVRRISETCFRAALTPYPDRGTAPDRRAAPDTGDLSVRVLHPRVAPEPHRVFVFERGGRPREVDLRGVRVRVEPHSPYGNLYLASRPSPPPAKPPERPACLAGPWSLWPDRSPIDDPVTLVFNAPDNATSLERVHVYRRTTAGWSCCTTERTGERLSVKTRRLGTFAVMEDRTPPRIFDIAPAIGGRPTVGSRTASRRPDITARVSDIGSGIQHVEVTLLEGGPSAGSGPSANGLWLLVAYDPERGRIAWERDHDLPEGHNTLRFEVRDKAGNTTTATRRIDIPTAE